MSNRDASSGKFKYPNRPMTPGESKPKIKHLNLRDATKPTVQHFQRGALSQDDGQARVSPAND